MLSWQSEEIIGLCVLLITAVGLCLIGKLDHDAVEAIKWIGGSFMASKGMANLLPEKPNDKNL